MGGQQSGEVGGEQGASIPLCLILTGQGRRKVVSVQLSAEMDRYSCAKILKQPEYAQLRFARAELYAYNCSLPRGPAPGPIVFRHKAVNLLLTQ